MSTTPAQVIRVIRFHLNELKTLNAHHEFEHLCRHLARLRVFSNVIPATGPVSAGGDAGRDFETFNTSVVWPLTPGSTFGQRASGSRKVAFACSLQEMIEGKIRSDIENILAGGTFDEVVYFCEANLPVAKRHALQRWALNDRGIELQIFDGQAIAELLSERDVFWIAQEFLHIPAEIMPRSAEDPDWYQEAVDRWKKRSPIPISQADFVEIKWALRHVVRDLNARHDLSFWIGHLQRFLQHDAPRELQRAAIYEIAVASLRGKGEMTSQLGCVRAYYNDLEEWIGIADLQDAATLVVYAFGAWALGHLEIDAVELFSWRLRVANCLDKHIEEAPGPGRKSGLLQARGDLCVLPSEPGGPPLTDNGFDYWNRMLDEAECAPLFPIEEFANYLSKTTHILGRHPRFPALTERVDVLLARRAGNAAAATKVYERALAYLQQEDLLNAIRELHRVQFKWFSAETLEPFHDVLLLLSRCYGRLRLAYAAKYYALAAALIARDADQEAVAHSLPRSLFAIAAVEDAAGNSLSFLQLLLLAIDAHCKFDPDPLQNSEHPEIKENLVQAAALRGLARRVGPEFVAAVDEVLQVWPKPLRNSVVDASDDAQGFWTHGSWDQVWETLEDAFLGRPFGDLGPRRQVEWRALGVRWSASFENCYAFSPVAEQFIAQLQIALVAFAELDLCLLPTQLKLRLRIRPKGRKFRIEEAKSTTTPPVPDVVVEVPGRPKPAPLDIGRVEVLAVIAAIVRRCSVLPDADFMNDVTAEALKNAAERVFIARPYSELYCQFLPRELFHEERRRSAPRFGTDRTFSTQEHPSLAWIEGFGPTYSEAVARDSVQARYERGTKCVGITVARLMQSAKTRGTLERLHAMGMKDWEVLSIVANAAANLRVRTDWKDRPTPTELERFRAAFEFKEDTSSALSPNVFTEQLIDATRTTFLGAFLAAWGLEACGEVRDIAALEKFLIRRYRLRSDDLDHADIFGWSESVASPASCEESRK